MDVLIIFVLTTWITFSLIMGTIRALNAQLDNKDRYIDPPVFSYLLGKYICNTLFLVWAIYHAPEFLRGFFSGLRPDGKGD